MIHIKLKLFEYGLVWVDLPVLTLLDEANTMGAYELIIFKFSLFCKVKYKKVIRNFCY